MENSTQCLQTLYNDFLWFKFIQYIQGTTKYSQIVKPFFSSFIIFLFFIFGITYEYAINSNATIQSERSNDGMMEVHAIYEHFNLAYVLM